MGPIRTWTNQNWTAIVVQAIGGILAVIVVAVWSGAWTKFEMWMWPRPTIPVGTAAPQHAPPQVTGIRVIVADDVRLPGKEEEISSFLREHLRGKNHVRALLPEESNLKIRNAPRGIWGWVDARDYSRNETYKVLGDPIDKTRINRQWDPYDPNIEFHLLDSGAIYILGFVSRDTLTMLRKSDSRGKDFTLYLGRWQGAPEIVAVPLDEVTLRDMRRIDTDEKARPYVSAYDLTVKR